MPSDPVRGKARPRHSEPSYEEQREAMIQAAQPLADRLRDGNRWLNSGKCCGQVDSDGICAAPACVFGEALKWFHAAADEIDRQEDMRRSDPRLAMAREALRAALDPDFDTAHPSHQTTVVRAQIRATLTALEEG